MAPSFANMPPYARAAFIRAQLDRLTGPDTAPSNSASEEPPPSAPQQQTAPEPQPIQRPRKKGPRSDVPTRAEATEPAPDPERHARKCSICNHPDRHALEAAFLQWRSIESIAYNFQIVDRRVILRHACATGLYQRRRLNFRCALENILERGDQVSLTAAGFVAAVRAYASLDDAGQWNEPVKRCIVSNEYVHSRPAEEPAPAPAESPVSDFSNRQFLELETELSHTK
jgi:hypothetical protein